MRLVVAEWLTNWLDGRQGIAVTTRLGYEVDVRRIVKGLGTRQLRHLTTAMISSFYADLSETLAAKTVKNTHATLHRALADAVRQGVLPRNPSDYAELPRAERHEMTVWSADELRQFLRHGEPHPLHAAFVLACSAGLRRSEVLGMRWSSVDLEKGSAVVKDSVVPARGEILLRLDETKNQRSRRVVALDPRTVAVLRAHRLKQKEERLAAGAIWQDLDLCCTSEDGGPVKPDTFTRTWKRLAKEAGVPELTPHAGARHSWASLALSAGVPLTTVSKRLGHSSVSTTADIYGHLSEQHDREAAELVAELFK